MSPRSRDVIVHDGTITLQGWAYSGNGNWVERVEISPDGYALISNTRRNVHADGFEYSGHVWNACRPQDLTQKVWTPGCRAAIYISCSACFSTTTPGVSGRSKSPSTLKAGLSFAVVHGILPIILNRLSFARLGSEPRLRQFESVGT